MSGRGQVSGPASSLDIASLGDARPDIAPPHARRLLERAASARRRRALRPPAADRRRARDHRGRGRLGGPPLHARPDVPGSSSSLACSCRRLALNLLLAYPVYKLARGSPAAAQRGMRPRGRAPLSRPASVPAAPGFLPRDPRRRGAVPAHAADGDRIAILGAIAIALFACSSSVSGRSRSSPATLPGRGAKQPGAQRRVEAPRGTIVDRNGKLLVSNVPGTSSSSGRPRSATCRSRARRCRAPSPLLGLRSARSRARCEAPRRPAHAGHDQDERAGRRSNYLLEHQAEFPGVEIAQTELRRYEQGDARRAAPRLRRRDLARAAEALERKGYAAGDRIGQTGIEARLRHYLRGSRGSGRCAWTRSAR